MEQEAERHAVGRVLVSQEEKIEHFEIPFPGSLHHYALIPDGLTGCPEGGIAHTESV